MEIIPVIYILKEKNVALYKGSLEQKDVYSRTPLEFARNFERDGAECIYIVDLDSSEFGIDINHDLILEIRSQIKIPLIYAGGIRSIDKIEKTFNEGFENIVLGVAAEPVYKEAIEKFGADKIIIGIKAKGNEVLTEKKTPFPLRVIDFAEKLPDMGVKKVFYKDVWKESTQIGPNYDEADRMIQMTSLQVYISGGIGKLKHLKLLKKIGVKGSLIGKALYENQLNLRECLSI